MNDRWPLQDFLELGALVSAVPCARLHARQVLWEWGIGNLGDSAELLVTELITNAVRASREAGRVSAVRLWLLSDSAQILILVWDASPRPPVLTDASDEAEHGRGLMLVDAVSEQWGWYSREDSDGKFVWAITRLCIPGSSHPAAGNSGHNAVQEGRFPRCLAHGPEVGRPIREAGKDVSADVVAESGDPVYESGILKDMHMSCGLAGHAVIRAQAGDGGRCMTGRSPAVMRSRSTAAIRRYALGSARYQSRRVAAGCSLRTDTMTLSILTSVVRYSE